MSGAAARETAQVDLTDCLDGGVIDVHDETRRDIEQLVVRIVEAAKKLGLEMDWHLELTLGLAGDRSHIKIFQ